MRLVVLAAALLASGPSIAAEPLAIVPLASDPALEQDAAKLVALLGAAELRRPVKLVGEGVRQASTGAQAQLLLDARVALGKAVTLLDELQTVESVQQAELAIARFEKCDPSEAFSGIAEGIGVKALALFAGGKSKAAAAELEKLFTLKPDFQVDPKRAGPDFRALCQQVQWKVANRPTVSLNVKSVPRAFLAVDGIERGRTPARVEGLHPGVHYVSLGAPGHQAVLLSVVVSSETTIEPRLTRVEGAGELAPLLAELAIDSGDLRASASAAERLGVDELLVVRLVQNAGERSAVLERTDKSGRVLGKSEATYLKPEEVALRVREAVGGPVAAPVPVRTVAVEARPAPAPSFSTSKRVGVALVGLAGACALGGVGTGIVASSKAREARQTPLIDPKGYEAAKSSAKTYALTADLLYGAAALGGVAGAWLLLSGPSETTVGFLPVEGGGGFLFAGEF